MGISILNPAAAASGAKTITGQYFSNSGNWTAPSGVNYVTAVVTAAGGGGAGVTSNNMGQGNSGAGGGTSSFHNISATGGGGAVSTTSNSVGRSSGSSGAQGKGGLSASTNATTEVGINNPQGGDGANIQATIAVTPGTNYSVTVGSGGSGGTFSGCANNGRNGGSGGAGYVSLTWEQ